MSGYFLLGVFRNLARNKLHSLINLASLSIGLAVFAFALLYTKQELGFDRGIPNAEHILRVTLKQKGIPGSPDGEFDSANARVFPALNQNFADEIDKSTRMVTTFVRPKDALTPGGRNLSIVDPAFADIFKLEVVSGSLSAALAAPGLVAMEESAAATFFPGGLKVGDSISLESGNVFIFNGQRQTGLPLDFQVAAIYRMPKAVSSPVNFQLITQIGDYAAQLFPKLPNGPNGLNSQAPWEGSNRIWLTLKSGVQMEALNARMPDFIDKIVTVFNSRLKAGDRISNHLNYGLQPLTDLHFHPLNIEQGGGDMSRVLTIAAIGMLVLLVGCSNSVSLSLASVMERRREIGIHKAVGALQRDILLQYLGESVLLALLAVLPALALVHWLLPPFLTLLNIRQAPQPGLVDYLLLPLIAALVGLASGIYPALVLSAVKPAHVLKVNNAGGMRSNQHIRTLLVGFQFCFALMLMIATTALYLQLQVARGQPLGFNPDNMIVTVLNSEQERKAAVALMQELRNTPGVREIVTASFPPNMNIPVSQNSMALANKNQEIIEAKAQQYSVEPDYFKLLQIPVLAGRVFDPVKDARNPQGGKFADQGADDKQENRLLLNRSAAKALGFASPLAAVDQFIFQQFSDNAGTLREFPARVLGVVEDSMYGSLRRKPTPEVYFPIPQGLTNMFLLKYDDAAKDSIQQQIKQVWQQITGTQLQYIQFVKTQIDAAYLVEQNESRLMLYCAGLALFLSCIGLYGLAAFTMERRTKEVGVRKVMGASVSAITLLFMWRYARPVLLSTLIASPIAVYFVLQWMERFPYQMDKLWLLPLCVAAAGTVLVIALLTVAGIVLKAAKAPPVQSLRYE